jgi:hypothetical protein
VHTEFVPEAETVNSELYREMMDRLLKRHRCLRPDRAESGNLLLLHDNAPSHNATTVKQFLTKKKSVTVL